MQPLRLLAVPCAPPVLSVSSVAALPLLVLPLLVLPAAAADEPITVVYQCDDQVPTVVRFDNGSPVQLAFVSRDSGPEIRMELAPSGSGARYTSGDDELWTKGPDAMLTVGGKRTDCKEVEE